MNSSAILRLIFRLGM